jgi:hypothetical protein
MDVLTGHVPILVRICLLFLIWDQVLMLLHLRLQVICQALQGIWQDQMDLLQVKVDLLQVIWQGQDQMDLLQVIWVQDQMDLLQVIWVQAQWDQMDHPQVIWVQDQMDHPQAIWVQAQWDQMDHPQAIWQVDQNSDQQLLLLIWDQKQWDPMDLLQAWIWTETECLRHLQVVKDRIHYLVKVDQLVDRHQVICLQVIRWVNQDRWMVDLELQAICLLQTEWVICIHTWTMQEHIKVQKDLLQEILDQCLGICQLICLRHQTIQMMVVR